MVTNNTVHAGRSLELFVVYLQGVWVTPLGGRKDQPPCDHSIRMIIDNRFLNLQDLLKILTILILMNTNLMLRIGMELNIVRIRNTKRQLNVVNNPMTILSSLFRQNANRLKVRLNFLNLHRRGVNNLIQIKRNMIMTLLNNKRRLFRYININKVLGPETLSHGTRLIQITKGTPVKNGRTIRHQTIRLTFRALPDRMRTTRIALTTDGNLRNIHTNNNNLRFTNTTYVLGRLARCNILLYQTRTRRNFTKRIYQHLSINAKNRYTPTNRKLLHRVGSRFRVKTLQIRYNRVTRHNRASIYRAILRANFHTNLDNQRGLRVSSYILRMTRLLNRMRTSVIHIQHPVGRRQGNKYAKVTKVNNINITTYHGKRSRHNNSRRNRRPSRALLSFGPRLRIALPSTRGTLGI